MWYLNQNSSHQISSHQIFFTKFFSPKIPVTAAKPVTGIFDSASDMGAEKFPHYNLIPAVIFFKSTGNKNFVSRGPGAASG
jgi:hypothetical protein